MTSFSCIIEYMKKYYEYKNLIGKKIKLTKLSDPYMSKYEGVEGFIEAVNIDILNDIKLNGTWGDISIYPNEDKFIILEDS